MNKKRIFYFILIFLIVLSFNSCGLFNVEKSEVKEYPLSFLDYGEKNFDLKIYTMDMKKTDNGMVWIDVNFPFNSYKILKVERFWTILPEKPSFNYKPFVHEFEETFFSNCRTLQRQNWKVIVGLSPTTPGSSHSNEATLIIRGAVVECDPGSKAGRILLPGLGVGKVAGGVIYEIFAQGDATPRMRFYTREVDRGKFMGGDSIEMLKDIFFRLGSLSFEELRLILGK